MGKEGQIKAVGNAAIIYGVIFLFLLIVPFLMTSWQILNYTGIKLVFILLLVLFVFSIPILNIVAGEGLIKHKNWARKLLIVLAIINLLNFPIGTGLGIWFLIVLFNDETKSLLK